MTFTIQNMEFYLLIFIRISGFVFTAPFFSYSTIPMRLKAAVSFFLAIIAIQMVPVETLDYVGVIGYSVLVLKEAAVGAILGFMCNLCFYIVNFAGQIMDMEMGLSMASMFDPMTRVQVTVTGNIYNYFIMLMLVVTNMHYYIIRAILDSFTYFNVGQAVFRSSLKDIMVDFMANYFVIAMRIVLPMFCCMLIINVVLGVLAKAAPQMNMFVVGMQIKVIAGLFILVLLVQTIPTVSDFIFTEMQNLISQVIRAFQP
ncbi:MAG: flagellar biosynthetic protein FliR [Eubacterium sp.]|nr:flagellar biosynthetic protein FliR [Eubacterium sp.]